MADEQEQKGGFWRKLGRGLQRALPVIEKGSARIAYAGGNKDPLRLILAREQEAKDDERQARLDAMAAETHDIQRRIGERTLARPEPPALEEELKLRQKYAKPTAPQVETFGNAVMERDPATGAWKPAMSEVQEPGVPSPPLMGAPVGQGPRLVRKPITIPPKPDTSISELDLQMKAQAGDPAARATLDRIQKDKIAVSLASRPPKPPDTSSDDAESLADMLEQTGDWARVPAKHRASVQRIITVRGATVLNPKQRESLQTVKQASDIVKDMDEASSAIHTTSTAPFARWGSAGAEKAEQLVFGNPELARLEAGQAALAPLIRTLGEKGNLANKDIDRAEAAAAFRPQLTRAEAKARLDTLRNFIKSAEEGIRAVAGRTGAQLLGGGQTPKGAPPPPDNSGNWKLQRNVKTGEMRWVPK